MRVNVYAEEITDRVEIICKEIGGQRFTGLRFYLELPAIVKGEQYRGPFQQHAGDDDSAAVTFWGKRDLREPLRKGLDLLDSHYAGTAPNVNTIAIGDALEGGIYAGMTIVDGRTPHALILLPEERKDLTWKDAIAFAHEQGGELPTRIDALVLFQNLRDRFEKDCYWTSEQYAGNAEYAWPQYFDYGSQNFWRKGLKSRARAVRRVAI